MTPEEGVIKFLSNHSPGHYFNVTEVWNWLYDRQNGVHNAHGGAKPPSASTIRKYLVKHADIVRSGMYKVRDSGW
jgi:hypothetical protein